MDGRVLAVFPVTETLRHARRQTPVVNATQCALVIEPGGMTGWRLLSSDHHCHVGVGAHETVTGDSDRERRLQLVWDVCLDDESVEPATVLRLRTPPAGERRERVHVTANDRHVSVLASLRRLITSIVTGGSRKG